MFELYTDITAISVVILWVAAPLLIVLTLIQYYLHKKIFDPIYFNINHFSAGELATFSTGFVFYLVKTVLYMRAITLPKTMRKRFKKDILTFKQHPTVYVSAWFTMLLIAYGGASVINIIIFLFIWEYRS